MENYCGTRLDGRYEIRQMLGVGGMAVVYKAYDQIDDRIVAVKILKDEYLTNEDFRRRFKNESKAIAVLSHPNIVKVYDVSYGDNLQYIVMEYVQGITLKEYIKKQGHLPAFEASHFLTQILSALQHAHDKGIVHRDVKPQNIMLLENGTIKVTDFGIARFSHSDTNTMSGNAVGSVHYIAPEQAKGEITDNKADIYSVGVVLYEMLTGTLPFDGDTAVSIALMQLQQEPRRPREINPDIPVGLEQIAMHAMQKRPGSRYQSAAEMLRDLEEYKRDHRVQFNYDYYVDEEPTRYVPKQPTQQRPVQPRPTRPSQPSGTKRPPQQRPVQRPVRIEEEEDEDEDSETNRTLPIIGGIIGGMVVLGIIILAACFAMGVFSEKVEVPNFVGMNYYEEVVNNSLYSDYNITVEERQDAGSYDAGVVFDQSPSARVKIRQKEEIKLFVMKAKDVKEVPDVYGYTFTEAITMIEAAGFKSTVEYEKDSGAAEKTVIRTNPERMTSAPKGTTVVIYVAAESDTVTVPKITGYDAQTAKELCESVGLEFEIGEEVNSEEKANVVLRITNYREEAQVPRGTVITVVVSNGKPAEATAKVSFRLPDTGEDGTIKVYLANELIAGQSKTLLLDGSTHSFEVTSSDDIKKLSVRINGSVYYECQIDFTQNPAKVTSEKTHTFVDSGEAGSGRGVLPSVVGFSYDEAYETLVSAGFTKIRRNDVPTSDSFKNDIVFQQDPPYKSLTRYAYSTEITLSVYKYQEG